MVIVVKRSVNEAGPSFRAVSAASCAERPGLGLWNWIDSAPEAKAGSLRTRRCAHGSEMTGFERLVALQFLLLAAELHDLGVNLLQAFARNQFHGGPVCESFGLQVGVVSENPDMAEFVCDSGANFLFG